MALFNRNDPQRQSSWPLLLARCAAVLVPVSTAGLNAARAVMFVLALCAPEAWRALPRPVTSPATLAAAGLFIALCASLFYTTAPMSEAVEILLKYRRLLLLPVLFLVFQGEDCRKWSGVAMWALFAALTLAMVLTFMNFFGWTAGARCTARRAPSARRGSSRITSRAV